MLPNMFADDEVTQLFSEESVVDAWLVERALAGRELGHRHRRRRCDRRRHDARRIDLASLRERTLVVGYPILPLLEQIVRASPEVGRFLHWGTTNQDVMDTGLAIVLGRALDRIETLLRELGGEVAGMPGRTHAQPAVPVTFGSKLAVWLAELTRHRRRSRRPRACRRRSSCCGAAGRTLAPKPRMAREAGARGRRRSLAHSP